MLNVANYVQVRQYHLSITLQASMQLVLTKVATWEVEDKVTSGSEIIDPTSGKKVSFVNTTFGCCGLGLLRMGAAFKGQSTLSVEGQDNVKLEAVRPKWWPSEWLEGQRHHTAFA
ncbi:putative transferase At4g12130, mitochondrial [Prosopis cineraria]|uniref:putative transferase At4g12130, mitochondrial n=1 Tax=Prosopis cineraria TaxID=364024 RepID=UPI00240F2ED1|nr:putative transferase At4g12130, mitochondrial [Prosopis cineraria]